MLGDEDEVDEGVEEDVKDAREVLRKELADDTEYNDEGQLMMKKGHVNRKEEEDEKAKDVEDDTGRKGKYR